MTPNNIIDIVISGIFSLGIIIMSIFLLSGRGGILIAGFNTMSKEEQDKYDKVALCRFMGKILLPIGIIMPCITVVGILDIFTWLIWVFIGASLGLIIFAIIYANTGNRFIK